MKAAAVFLITSSALWVQAPEKKGEKKEVSENTNPDGVKTIAVEKADAKAIEEETLPDVVVTATREEEKRRDVPMSIGKIKRDSIKDTKPIHPSEL
ncbi:MAG: hypothetical protein J0L53_16790, partial [Spirochaetes bacterium]|nr:hypothetical protein [Spirochaetota bacterium]